MAEVSMSLEEYESLRAMAMGGQCPSCAGNDPGSKSISKKKKRRSRKKSASDRKMSAALKEATAKAKKKNGDFKKGWNQSKLMTEAHRLKKRM